jgi:L-asparagine permease
VVVFGIPILAVALYIGWMVVKPKVVANTGGRIQSIWTKDGARYMGVAADDLDPDENVTV